MIFDPNGLFYFMAQLMSEKYFSVEEKDRVCIRIRNEGSSRSSKTFDFFHLLVWIYSNNPNSGLTTYIYRDTLTNCRDFTLKDFQESLRVMGIYDSSKLRNYSQKPEYNLFGNMVYFRGLEDDIEYPPCHICFFNEAMEVSEAAYKAASKRCSMLDVADWNPKFTDHWIFKHEGQPNTWFTHTDYRNNKHIDQALVKKFESWCPWEFEDLDLPENQRRVNKVNQQNRTIDRVQWLIYGRGIRCAMEGLIFGGEDIPVTYVDSAPEDYEARYFGLDFGNTTGTWAFTDNRKIVDGIVYDCPIYNSFGNAGEFFQPFREYYKKTYKDTEWLVICDSANPQYINDLNAYASQSGLNVVFLPCKKFEGCVEWRIGLMKRNGVILVNRSWIRSEQENYFWDSINGIQLQKAKKNGHDHFFDSAGMSIQYETDLR